MNMYMYMYVHVHTTHLVKRSCQQKRSVSSSAAKVDDTSLYPVVPGEDLINTTHKLLAAVLYGGEGGREGGGGEGGGGRGEGEGLVARL